MGRCQGGRLGAEHWELGTQPEFKGHVYCGVRIRMTSHLFVWQGLVHVSKAQALGRRCALSSLF